MEPTTPAAPPQSPIQKPKESTFAHFKHVVSSLSIFILAPLIALLLTAFVFQSYEVDGPSMETTLQHRDRLIVLKLPKTWNRLLNRDYAPKRYEIIVFNKQAGGGLTAHGEDQLIKRVIAVPGDRVTVKNGVVTVYNQEHPNGYNPDENQAYAASFSRTEGNVDLTIDKGEVFVLGDNRANSSDSRAFGPVPSRDIVGELLVRIYPFNKVDGF